MEKKRFIINGDGTVTDTKTGLMWQQETAGPIPWEAAMSYCKDLTLGGHTDWRDPNINELQSLVDYIRYNPAKDIAAFPGTKSSYDSSSATYVSSTAYAWCVDFHDGYVSDFHKSFGCYVRAVRG